MLEYSGHYDADRNIAFAVHKGAPKNNADMEKLGEFHSGLWGRRNHRVYIITDVTEFGPISVSMIQHYAAQTVHMRKTRIAMSVMIVSSEYRKLSAKLFELVTTQRIHTVSSMDEALELVGREQAAKGVFPPL